MYYLPNVWAVLVAWCKNLLTELPAAATKLNEPPADVVAVQADLQELLDAIAAADLATENYKKATAAKIAAKKKCGRRIRAFVTRVKANPLYTEDIGSSLRILNSFNKGDKTALKPVITARQSGGFVQIVFSKQGTDGLNIYSKLPGEKEFALLATAIKNPYTDTRPPAQQGVVELRQYMAMYISHNDEVGQWSEVIVVSYSG